MSCTVFKQDCTEPSQQLINHLQRLTSNFDIPSNAKRITINFRRSEYYQSRQGYHPVEVQLERSTEGWSIVFIASFSYPDDNAEKVEVELYFNFLGGWFYQPDIDCCDLHQPQVTELYVSWEQTLLNQLTAHGFDTVTATLISTSG
ncbi:hypothetical protein BI375_07955 [Vibrio rotiferianus]|uniref:DUF2787 domain-containing protein n=1 Tax=Vibrio rotiferianus TaxID=190895 RepID=A0ABX3D4P3_9VIBR|nr:DUF2787 family protein [Vibrio rotiferianus]OHY90172.1 hypothetical protein BI375_07955 [Vibrio rotiferianus]